MRANRPGITGFGAGRAPVADTLCQLQSFNAAVQFAARSIGARVVRLEGASVTPNFHIAYLDTSDSLTVLCNSTLPVIAFATPPVRMGALTFVASPRLAHAFESLGYECPSLNELTRPMTSNDLENLDEVERKQVAYWMPARLGDVAFNWFD